ncbi:excinuclease ABC subunit UvrA [Patescibacteria group bacterium]|nr:excinuclease ABC subunit UvrA [Patescibacteria group bacterium]
MLEEKEKRKIDENDPSKWIEVKGARTHNLKNITVKMPRNKMVAVTGLSGSGKSSLVFDTIFAEGQRKYIESLSAYARQFISQMKKPDVDEITGLSPAISIDQKSRSNNPRSTVATITEIYDYLRILYARVGQPYCLECGKKIEKLSKEEIQKFILKKINEKNKSLKKGDLNEMSLDILAPVVKGRKGEYYQLLYDLLGKGYSNVVIDGKKHSLREKIVLTKTKKHNIDVVVDTIHFADLKEEGEGLKGLIGKAMKERLLDSIEKSINESGGLVKNVFSDKEELLLSTNFSCPMDGYSYPEIEPRLFSFNSPYGACPECKGLGTDEFWAKEICKVCKGARLRPEALNVYLYDGKGGKKNIVEVTALPVNEAKDFFDNIQLTDKQKKISEVLIREILERLIFMKNVGIEYLTLDRRANTLSGGEAQRIRLASQLGSGLVGALYVLDEPTIGLHSKDNDRLIKTLLRLKELGNTIIVVEHDEDTIYSADYLVDIGPGAGTHGGEEVVSGYLDDLLTAEKNESGSRTLAYLREEKKIEIPEKRRTSNKGFLRVEGGKIFNIENMKVELPLSKFVTITGVSGSGKSSFVYEILHKNLRARFDRKYRSAKVFNCAKFSGAEYLSRAILINQSPIGRTSRSNPATYTGVFTHIRELFEATTEARARGWKSSRFSFNVKGGRCEACQGKGEVAVEMHFLPTVNVSCDVCNGKRYTKETLEVKYKGKNINEVLSMTIEEALNFFNDIPAIYDRLKTLMDVGLGYLELGQPASTLSGGESQRVKIASELYRPITQKTIYLLDEPTIGLHYDDVKKLIEILQKLVDRGNTVVVIEHNMDLIKSSDYVVDIGPDGGVKGGKIVAKGTPEEVADTEGSHTGEYLRRYLK